MTLVDAGPLIALIDADDRDHQACVGVLPELSAPLLTTWPAFTEAVYLLGERAGWTGQELLWRMVLRGDLRVESLDETQLRRSRDLMKKYADLPMDLADATLVALAEDRNLRRIFTLDEDFGIYRLHGRKRFETIPDLP
jgi:hypothetical protein